MLTATLEEKVTYAKKLVDHWSDGILTDIVSGKYPPNLPDLYAFSDKRRGVYERACLIVLDVRSEGYPKTVESWSKDELEKRILRLRTGNRNFAGEDRRAIAQSKYIDGDKLDDRWG